MPQTLLQGIPMLIATALALLAFSVWFDPQRPHARWLRRSVTGLIMLCVWNALPLPELGINPLSVMITGSLGLPGLGLMAVAILLP